MRRGSASPRWPGIRCPDLILELLSSSPQLQEHAVAFVAATAGSVAVYFGSLYVAAWVVPTAIRAAITRWKLDRVGSPLSPLLRFHDAPWYYLLTSADFAPGEEPEYISIAAVIDVAG